MPGAKWSIDKVQAVLLVLLINNYIYINIFNIIFIFIYNNSIYVYIYI